MITLTSISVRHKLAAPKSWGIETATKKRPSAATSGKRRPPVDGYQWDYIARKVAEGLPTGRMLILAEENMVKELNDMSSTPTWPEPWDLRRLRLYINKLR